MRYIWLIPLLPGLGALVNGVVGIRAFSRRASGLLACATMTVAFGLSLVACWQLLALPSEARAFDVVIAQWIPKIPLATHDGFAALEVPWGFRLDPLSGMMLLVVTGIGLLIHVYSTAYMADEPRGGVARFFSYLNLFCFFMLMLVLGNNFLVMFVGWEGVGLCSYLLIGYWYEKKSASDAGKKAFITNRIGDWGFVLGVFLVYFTFGTFDFRAVQNAAAAMPVETAHFGVVSAICLLLFVGAIGKSAQIPLYVWLPDAMEGPTPVSALIHAATMVTAGVYMVGRNAVLFSHAPMVMEIVAIVGVLTALMAASIGLVQYDIKRVLAYSTISQLGYMFLAVGVGAFGAGIFHLTSHAFFKALLFLAAGGVMHALGGETDMRRMGGLARRLPRTAGAFAIGALALAGIPPLSGFFSKDLILSDAFRVVPGLWGVGLVAAGVTSVYIVRAFALTFLGASSLDTSLTRTSLGAHEAAHDPPPVMAAPTWILAGLTALGGVLGWSFTHPGILERFLQPVLAAGSAVYDAGQVSRVREAALVAVSVAVAVLSAWLGWLLYVRRTVRLASPGLHRLLQDQYVEHAYEAAVVAPSRALARAAAVGDRSVIDAAVTGVAASIGRAGRALRGLQTGYLTHYAAFVLIGALLMLLFWVWR